MTVELAEQWWKSPYYYYAISVLFHDGKPAFFRHTAGDGWNQTGDNRTDKQHKVEKGETV
jgi:hypothetical protein